MTHNCWFSMRKAIVFEAIEKGIKPTARRFNMSKNTLRLWLRRFKSEGNDGLMDRRNGPKHIPHKTSEAIEAHVLAVRRTASCYGARRLKHYFRLAPSNWSNSQNHSCSRTHPKEKTSIPKKERSSSDKSSL